MSVFALECLVAYLLGSVSGSLIVGRARGVDIRTLGSGNAGGTNALRTQGWRFALAVVAIDIGKGALAAELAYLPPHAVQLTPPAQALAFGLACAIGHIWPLFFGFRGGKGAAVLIGAVAVALPHLLLPLFLLWLLVLGFTGYVGLATILAAVAFPLLVYWLAPRAGAMTIIALACAFAVLILFAHRANLARLLVGRENRFERARFLARWLGRVLPSKRA